MAESRRNALLSLNIETRLALNYTKEGQKSMEGQQRPSADDCCPNNLAAAYKLFIFCPSFITPTNIMICFIISFHMYFLNSGQSKEIYFHVFKMYTSQIHVEN